MWLRSQLVRKKTLVPSSQVSVRTESRWPPLSCRSRNGLAIHSHSPLLSSSLSLSLCLSPRLYSGSSALWINECRYVPWWCASSSAYSTSRTYFVCSFKGSPISLLSLNLYSDALNFSPYSSYGVIPHAEFVIFVSSTLYP